VEVREVNDIANGGFGSSLLLGMIHSGYTSFVIGWRSPSLMSHDVFLLVKVERPHGSIEGARKHSVDNGSGGNAGGVSSLSFACCGRWKMLA
jgi:hypothetical protein